MINGLFTRKVVLRLMGYGNIGAGLGLMAGSLGLALGHSLLVILLVAIGFTSLELGLPDD